MTESLCHSNENTRESRAGQRTNRPINKCEKVQKLRTIIIYKRAKTKTEGKLSIKVKAWSIPPLWLVSLK